MANNPEIPRLRAYMLRFWEVRSRDTNCPPTWRFSLEDPHTGDRIGFADLQALVSFLETELADVDRTADENATLR
jgi:hypothetical protein